VWECVNVCVYNWHAQETHVLRVGWSCFYYSVLPSTLNALKFLTFNKNSELRRRGNCVVICLCPLGQLLGSSTAKTCSYTKNSFARTELLPFVSVWVFECLSVSVVDALWMNTAARIWNRIRNSHLLQLHLADWLTGKWQWGKCRRNEDENFVLYFWSCSLHHLHICTTAHPLTSCHIAYSYSYNLFRQHQVAGPGQVKRSQDRIG